MFRIPFELGRSRDYSTQTVFASRKAQGGLASDENASAFLRNGVTLMDDSDSFSALDSPLSGPTSERRIRRIQNALQRRKSDRAFLLTVVPQSLDGLREHPIFNFEDTNISGSIPRETLSETQRGPLFEAEVLRMFRQRIRLVAVLGIVLLPIFSGLYFVLAPATASQIMGAHVLMMAALAAIFMLTGSLQRWTWARPLSLIGYAIYGMGSAAVITIVTQDGSMNDTGNRAVQFVVLASYIHILLSILLLPYSLWESWIAVLVIGASVGWGMSWTATANEHEVLYCQIFLLLTTAFMILCISHLQSLLRRNVFDSAFDLALTATRMQEMSATDTLTGGFNRRHLEQMLPGELTRAARFGINLSLIMFDLDNFKSVNDTLGHAAGDEVLREIWRRGHTNCVK